MRRMATYEKDVATDEKDAFMANAKRRLPNIRHMLMFFDLSGNFYKQT